MKTLWGSAPSFATWSAMSFPLGMWFCLCRDNPALTATKAKTTQLFLCYLLCPVPLWKHGPAEASREQPQSPAWDPVTGRSRPACSVLGVQRGRGSPPAALRTVLHPLLSTPLSCASVTTLLLLPVAVAHRNSKQIRFRISLLYTISDSSQTSVSLLTIYRPRHCTSSPKFDLLTLKTKARGLKPFPSVCLNQWEFWASLVAIGIIFLVSLDFPFQNYEKIQRRHSWVVFSTASFLTELTAKCP